MPQCKFLKDISGLLCLEQCLLWELASPILFYRRLYASRYIELELGQKPDFLGLGLSSRKNMCCHPEVSQERTGKVMDAKCRELTASFVRSKNEGKSGCEFFNGFEATGKEGPIERGVYNLSDIKDLGRKNMWCPYFLARYSISVSNAVVYSYHYLLDPKIAELVSKELGKDSVVVFDEAHNIDSVCIESMSVNIHRRHLDSATQSIRSLKNSVNEVCLYSSVLKPFVNLKVHREIK